MNFTVGKYYGVTRDESAQTCYWSQPHSDFDDQEKSSATGGSPAIAMPRNGMPNGFANETPDPTILELAESQRNDLKSSRFAFCSATYPACSLAVGLRAIT